MTDDVVKASQTATTGGRKFDGGKLQYGLLPPLALKATVEILTFGAEKYEPDNWKYVPDSKRRYINVSYLQPRCILTSLYISTYTKLLKHDQVQPKR